jgi:hypothetical protein
MSVSGWPATAHTVLELLEGREVAGAIAVLRAALEDGPAERRITCPHCPAAFEWPGLRDDRVLRAHPDAADELPAAA